MLSEIIRETGESVTIVRLSADKDEEMIIASEIMCLIDPVEGQYDHWKASLKTENSDIRKGDILRQGDGSELEVLRTFTESFTFDEEITQLDLKDYDPVERPLPAKDVDISKTELLPEYQFHPIIAQKVWTIFLQGDYDTAVFQAFKQVEIAVREAGYYADTELGVSLMRNAFHKKDGALTDSSQQPAEKQARSDLFAGAIGSYKNPSSHHNVKITDEEAVELITLASHLLRIVDSRKQSGES